MIVLEKIRAVLIKPKDFFRRIRKERGMKRAFLFSVLLSPLSLIIGALLNAPDSVAASAAGIGFLPYNAAVAAAFLGAWILSVLLTFAVAFVYQMFAALLKGSGKYDASYKAAVYSNVPTYLLGWLWFPFPIIVAIWSIVLSAIGLKELHSLNAGKAFAVAIMPVIILIIIAFFASLVLPLAA